LIVRAGIAAVSGARLVSRAIEDLDRHDPVWTRPLRVVAVGKAASAMADAFMRELGARVRGGALVSIRGARAVPPLALIEAGHPVPDAGSLEAGQHALAIASGVGPDECFVVLLSGGASALLSAPAAGLTLDDLKATNRALLMSGADIHAMNTVRKHLSAVKGGWLAAAARGDVRTLAISDVVGDELSVIGSGPTVPDRSTFAEAEAIIARSAAAEDFPEAVRAHLARGARGEVPETPKPGDPRLARSTAQVIGGRGTAIDGARREAEARGYDVLVVDEPLVGEARLAAVHLLDRVQGQLGRLSRPLCVLSAGETTVTVKGHGKGGRNQELALAAAPVLDAFGTHRPVVLASVGTDGIDGPTDAAGAIADTTTLARARAAGLDATRRLDDNDAYPFFAGLGDLIKTGPTDTNVGDLQVVLIGQ
jgi:hydroxypyruvate reductase